MNKAVWFLSLLVGAALVRTFVDHGYTFDRQPGDTAMLKLAERLDATLPQKINSSVTLWAVAFEDKALRAYYTYDDYGAPGDGRIVAMKQQMRELGCNGAWKPVIDAGYRVQAEIGYVDEHGPRTTGTGVDGGDCVQATVIRRQP